MAGHAGAGLHYHGNGAQRFSHVHAFLHINHTHDEPPGESEVLYCDTSDGCDSPRPITKRTL